MTARVTETEVVLSRAFFRLCWFRNQHFVQFLRIRWEGIGPNCLSFFFSFHPLLITTLLPQLAADAASRDQSKYSLISEDKQNYTAPPRHQLKICARRTQASHNERAAPSHVEEHEAARPRRDDSPTSLQVPGFFG